MKRQRISATPDSVATNISWGGKGHEDGKFWGPVDVALGSSGLIYVLDSGNHRVQCFHADGRFAYKWGGEGRGDRKFVLPRGIAVGQYDAPILASMHEVAVLAAFPPGVLSICTAYMGADYVCVSDTGNDRIQVFDAAGLFVRQWGQQGDKEGELHYPWGCALYDAGLLYVSDSENRRIQVFSIHGVFVRAFNIPEGRPRSVAIGRDGLVYITCSFVSCRRRDGTLVNKFSFDRMEPCGLCIDSAGFVYGV